MLSSNTREKLSKTQLTKHVNVHHFAHKKSQFSNHSEKDMLSVCLWGPPGSGKSSALAHIKFMLDDETILFINMDTWADYWIKHLFPHTFTNFVHDRAQASVNETTWNAHIDREAKFKLSIRDQPFHNLQMQVAETQETTECPQSLYDMMQKFFMIFFEIHIDLPIWQQFCSFWKTFQPDMDLETKASTAFVYYRFAPWWAKQTMKRFILETTGRVFDPVFLQYAFSGTKNILYIPFVYDLSELESRVKARSHQFGNPPLHFVSNIFERAYGYNLIQVIDSALFDQIVIQGNHSVNYVMMSLELVVIAGKSTYILVKEQANDMNEAIYIQALLHAMFIPPELHTEKSLVYDTMNKLWLCHP